MPKGRQSSTLVRNIELTEMRMGTEWVLRNRRCHAMIYGHLGSYEQEVEEIRQTRIIVIRYLNILHAHWAAQGWILESWERFLWDLATELDFWLRDRTGQIVRFKWFGQGPMYNWAKAPNEAFDRIRRWLNDSAPRIGRHLYLDQAWPILHSWMFLDEELRIRDLAAYSHTGYLRGLQKLARAAGWPKRRIVRVNGEWDLDESNLLATYENADVGNHARYLFTETLPRWLDHPGGILTLCGNPQSLHLRRVVRFWTMNGGWLLPEDQNSADYALDALLGPTLEDLKL